MVNVKDTFRSVLKIDAFYNFFFMKRLKTLLGDGDALILVPYSDGVLFPKRGFYEKHLVGNYPGYYTEDGDIYLSEGWGDPKFYFFGIPAVLALNPSEHAAVLDPLKALIAHKRDIGQFVRVDNEGNALEVGEAVKKPEIEEVEEGGEMVTADGGSLPTASQNPVQPNYRVHDGLFDVTPPMIKDEEGEVVDQADGWIISQAKAASLVPSKISSSELRLMQQRERNAMADAAEFLKYIIIGAAGASIMWMIFIFILAVATGTMPGLV